MNSHDLLRLAADWLRDSGNTLPQLGLVVGVSLVLVVGRLVYKQRTQWRNRRRVSLVLGGWGTRGKSGVERKKAALISALGARFVSKTTGCEAMFIPAYDLERPRELVLFRPHNKASIWE